VTANTITYRLNKGSALTYQELDDNFRYLDAKEAGGAGATFDIDGDTGMDPEVSEDEDILRFFVGNSIPGYSNVQSIMTLAANGLIVNMGQSNQVGSTVDGAPIILQAGSGANAVFHVDTKRGDIELRPGNYNTYANTNIANTSTPSREGVVRVIGPNTDGPGVIRFYDTDRDKFVGISGPDILDTSYELKLPLELGTIGQALVLQNSSGNTTWGAGGGSYSNTDVDTHLQTSTASSSEVLSWDGAGYDWVAQSGWEFIDSYTAAADAEITVSADGFDSVSPVSFLDGYTYKVEFDGHGSVDNGLIQFELFENGSYRTGVGYYRNQFLRLRDAIVSHTGNLLEQGFFSTSIIGISMDSSSHIIAEFFNLGSTTYRSSANFHGFGNSDTYFTYSVGSVTVATADMFNTTTKFKLLDFNGGNITGVFDLYRRKIR
jgi:hypothetical protein